MPACIPEQSFQGQDCPPQLWAVVVSWQIRGLHHFAKPDGLTQNSTNSPQSEVIQLDPFGVFETDGHLRLGLFTWNTASHIHVPAIAMCQQDIRQTHFLPRHLRKNHEGSTSSVVVYFLNVSGNTRKHQKTLQLEMASSAYIHLHVLRLVTWRSSRWLTKHSQRLWLLGLEGRLGHERLHTANIKVTIAI